MTTVQIAIAALAISIASVLLSLYVAWWTLWRRGGIKMTRPAMIALLYEHGRPKIWLRTMFYSTGKQGHVLESLFLKVRRGESVQTFSHWVYRQDERMMVGSGLKIGEDGISYDQHFLLPRDGSDFRLLAGVYNIDVHAVLSTSSESMCLGTYSVTLSEEQSKVLFENKEACAFFEWGPDSQKYHVDVETRRPRNPEELAKLLLMGLPED